MYFVTSFFHTIWCVCVCVCVCVCFNWRIIALQCCVGFCHTTVWISPNCVCVCVCMCMYSLPCEPPSPLPSHSKLSRSQAGLPLLYSSCPLAGCFTHDSAHMSVPLSQFVPPSSSPTVFTVCSLCLHLHSFPANRFISTVFLDFIYMHYMGYCSLSDWLHSV